MNRHSLTVAASLSVGLLFSAAAGRSVAAEPPEDARRAATPQVAGARATDVRATDAWIRWLPAGLPGAGYMTLTNGGSAARVLTGASSPAYARIEFHRTQSAGGMNTMSPVDAVTLAPHASVAFGEGGYHLMLMQPTHPVLPGERVPITLEFSGGQTLTVSFTVRGAGAAGQ